MSRLRKWWDDLPAWPFIVPVVFFVFYGWRLVPVWVWAPIVTIVFSIVAGLCVWESHEDNKWRRYYELRPLTWDGERMVPTTRDCPVCDHKMQVRQGELGCRKCGWRETDMVWMDGRPPKYPARKETPR